MTLKRILGLSSTLIWFAMTYGIFLAWAPTINKKYHQNLLLRLVEITAGKLLYRFFNITKLICDIIKLIKYYHEYQYGYITKKENMDILVISQNRISKL